MSTTLTFYIDNLPHPSHPELTSEHGLSLGIATTHEHWLCDLGKSAAFVHNATLLGHDLTQLDGVFLSHGHNDHTGGLSALLDLGGNCPIYAQRIALHTPFYSAQHGHQLRNISTSEGLEVRALRRLKLLDDSQWIGHNIAAIRLHSSAFPQPYGNQFLLQGDAPRLDTFEHEMAWVEVRPDGLIIVSSCSHHGVLNILADCCAWTGVNKVKAFVGGMHFVDSNQTEQEVNGFLNEVQQRYTLTEFYTGHCTGPQAQQLLAASHCPNIQVFHTGSELIL